MVTLKEVLSEKDLKTFVRFPLTLYKENSRYVPPILKDELRTLYTYLNGSYPDIRARYWLAEKDGKVVGRIAGIIRQHGSSREARFGWLDFVDDQIVVNKLFKEVEMWFREEKISYLHGPLGFISFDRSGILIKGFEEMPTFFSSYNYPYYQNLIEQAGYSREFNWVEYNINVPDQVPEKIIRGSEMVRKRYGLVAVDIRSKKELMLYSEDVRKLLNESYANLEGFSQLSKSEFDKLYRQFRSFVSADLFALIKDRDENIIGFGLVMPDLSEALIKMKGKFFPFGPWYIYRALKLTKTADLLLIAIKPEYQHKGVHSLIFEKILTALIKRKIRYVESTKELENNFKIRNLWSDFDHRQHKVSTCYAKNINS